jgi:hypothetical protein
MAEPTDISDLYRFYDAGGNLLYVGRSAHAVTRMESHKSDKDWWVEVARMDVEHVPTAEITSAELRAIAAERPKYNVAGQDAKIKTAWPVLYPAAEYQRRYRAKLRGGPPRQLQPCGTRAAAMRHRRNGEPLCDACGDAERAYMREMSKKSR